MNSLVRIGKNYRDYADQVFNSLDVRENTRYEYQKRIVHFEHFVGADGFSLNVLLNYKRALAANNDYAISTKNKYLACARIFLKECHRQGLIDRDITSNVKGFQQTKKHKKNGLDDGDISLICEWIANNRQSHREIAMLCLLMFQGLRQAEICSLLVSDISLSDSTLSVRSKGRDDKDRIYLHPQVKLAIRSYLSNSKQTDYLFTSLRGLSSSQRLTERGLRLIVTNIFSQLGIDKNVHGFRHYFTTRLIQQMPGNLIQIAQFTRHRSLEMLQVYNDSLVEQSDVVHFHAAFNELEKQIRT